MEYWYSWLCKTNLDPSLIYEYSLLFSNNELEEDDIAHFDHEFLQSMGISIAKHRLEILKLASRGRYKTTKSPRPVARLLAAINKTKKWIKTYIRCLIIKHDASSAAMVVVPTRPRPAAYLGGGRSGRRPKGRDMLKRSKKFSHLKYKQRSWLTLSGGGGGGGVSAVIKVAAPPPPSMVSMAACRESGNNIVDEDIYWGSRTRWESMFQDLKPT